MDRIISEQEINRSRLKLVVRMVIALAAVAVALLAIRYWLKPSVDMDDLMVSVVELGPIIAAIAASGSVVPQTEQTIAAASDGEIQQVFMLAGQTLKAGEPILKLDSSALEADIRDLDEQLALKENARLSTRLSFDKSLTETNSKLALLKIDLESRNAKLTRLQTLAETGAVSQQDVLEAELNVRRTQVEIEQLESQVKNLSETSDSDLARIDLEASILRNRRQENQRKLELATLRAPIDGVLTWVVNEPGTRVSTGTPLARVADLNRYQIEATLSDFYAQEIQEGQETEIKIAEQPFPGRVNQVLPTVENGTIKLRVDFTSELPPGLKPQLRVDVDIITDRIDNALRIKRGPALNGAGVQQLYRIDQNQVVRTEVNLGASNRHYFQVLNGLSSGDEVVVSDTRAIQHLSQLLIR